MAAGKNKMPQFGTRAYRFPGKKPTPAQLKLKVGKRYEDGSFKTTGGGKYDPDTGTIKRPRKRRTKYGPGQI